MLSRTIFLSLIALLSFTVSTQAQRICVVDVTAVLESVPAYTKAQQDLDRVATQWRQEISQEQDKIKGMYSKYQADQVLLSEEMRKQREEEITNKEKDLRELQRRRFGPEGDLFKKRQELVKPIQESVYAAIEEYAKNKGFDFIFDKGSASGILFADPRFEKTEDLIKSLK